LLSDREGTANLPVALSCAPVAKLVLRRSEPGGPSYALRRLGAVALVVVAAVVVWRLGASAFGSGGTALTAAGRSPSPSPTLAASPTCSYGKARANTTAYSDWSLTLVDTRSRLTRAYVPPNLASVQQAGFGGDFKVRAFLIEDLAALGAAAEDAGNPVAIVAAYRSYDQQVSLFGRRVEDLGYEDAIRKTALPGHSEHQLGTAVDFKTLGEEDVDQRWESTPAGRWVAENAHSFGFVQSYPRGKTELTCYAYEPWHYRYFGRGMAARIHDSGLTVREFLWNVDKGFIQP
jgi:D-alanyl-D-alanine carboxypeptidase